VTYVRGGSNVHVTGRRVVATIVDAIVLGIASGILAGEFGSDRSSGFGLTHLSPRGSILPVAFALLYYVVLEGLLGRTVGKMLTGIRVVNEATGQPPGLGKATVRTVLRIIDGLAGYLVGFVIVLGSSRRRRLGDMAAGTLVVRDR
jgi:uncharacterized RDD family membrane protein YckC